MKTAYDPAMENGAGYLSQVPGIDALITGHQHLLFPDTSATSTFVGQPGVDPVRGLVNGVPAVQAGQWGRSEEHTSELQSLMRISYAVLCFKNNNKFINNNNNSKHCHIS